MVAQRPLLITNGVETQIAGIFASAASGVIVGHGLIVGQRSMTASGNDHAIYLARTPLPDDITPENISPLELQNKIGGPDIDMEWMSEHTKQVTRMLPGGLRVLGLLLVDGTEVTDSTTHFAFKKKVEKLLEKIETINGKTAAVDREDLGGEVSMYVLNVNRSTNFVRLQSVQFQVDAVGNICKDSEVKWKTSVFKSATSEDKITSGPWQVVKTNFILDYPVVFSPTQTEELTLSGKADVAIEKVKSSISKATILFDGMKRVHNSSGNYLDPTIKETTTSKKDSGKKSKGKSKRHQNDDEHEESQDETDQKAKEYTADILLGGCGSFQSDDTSDEITQDTESRLKLGGKMCVRVYMRPRATIKETSNAVKEDILRSLRARLEMHCDSLVGEETKGTEKENTPIVHEPPRRCLIGIPRRADFENFDNLQEADSVMISDFLFPGETSYDSIESVTEVFGFEPSISSMDDDQELVAGIQHLNVNSSGELTVGNVTHTASNEDGKTFGSPSKLASNATKSSNYNLVAIVLSVLVAIAGICVSYLAMSTGTNASNEEDEFFVPSRTQEHHPKPDSE